MRFPELHAHDLDGRAVTLPDDAGTSPTLLLVHFTPRPTGEETWYPLAAELAHASPGFWCYDLLVLPEFPEAVQSSLTDELRTAPVRSEAPGVRSLTAHTDLTAFRRALVLDRAAQTYALLLHDGHVRWRAFGPLTTPLERRLSDTVSLIDTGGDTGDLVVS